MPVARPRAEATLPFVVLAVVPVVVLAVVITLLLALIQRSPGLLRLRPGDPPAGAGMASAPLGTPATVAFPSASYSFLFTQSDGRTPVTWDPCRAIHYVVRPDHEPPGGAAVVRAAVAEISAATGLQFIDDGATDESPQPDREPYQPERYPGRWASVLIAWQSPTENTVFATDVVGQASPVRVQGRDGNWVYVTGQVLLDGESLGHVLARPGGADLARTVIEHELGHLVGLGHTDDQLQAMYPQATAVITQLGGGDRAGLAALGVGPCRPGV